jgi:hypothetical protein
MRRAALMLAGVAFLCALATATPATALPLTLRLIKDDAHHTRIYPRTHAPWIHGQTEGYWGKFTSLGTQGGSYRATCTWLANMKWPASPKQDNRLSCTVVIAFQAGLPKVADANASGVVLQGLVKRPVGKQRLFEAPSVRRLVVTGGTGTYAGAYGYADLGPWLIVIHYGLLPLL